MTTFEKFEYLVEDPFYSPSAGGEVRIDDMSNVYVDENYSFTLTENHSAEIDEFYEEWARMEYGHPSVGAIEMGINIK